MDISTISPQGILSRLESLVSHLIGQEDFYGSKEAEKLKHELEYYFEVKRQEAV